MTPQKLNRYKFNIANEDRPLGVSIRDLSKQEDAVMLINWNIIQLIIAMLEWTSFV